VARRRPETGERRFWHEYFYELIQTLPKESYEGDPEECWLLAAAKANLPIVVPGHEDSTFGNIFASHVKLGECGARSSKSGIEYMVAFYDQYQELSKGGLSASSRSAAASPATSRSAWCPRSSTTCRSP
jgi:deoxyhypusine synthase